MEGKIKNLLTFLLDNWCGLILLMTLILFLVFLVGFFRNGEFNTNYNLEVVWTGVGATATAATAGIGKWFIDSRFNSKEGSMPYV